jgi:Peptidase family C25
MKTRKFYTMKKLFTLAILLYSAYSFAQPYNNEWINPAKTYYKFKTARTGLFRIPQPTLAAIGLSATPAQQFQLWRNGAEVPLYTSVISGLLPANGYIEFWSDANDGKADKPLYRDPAYQHTDKTSLQTDTVAYFLTINAGSANLRFADAANNVAGNVLPAEPYFMYTDGTYFRERINPGFAAVVGEYVYSSSYDKGEFWSTTEFRPANPRTYSKTGLFPFSTGPVAQIKFGASGNALNTRTIQAKINGSLVKDTLCDYFSDVIATASFPASLISGGNADVQFVNTSSTATDRIVVSYYELTYARLFNFGGLSNFNFTLPATSSGNFLQIVNFNNGSAAPVLYDVTNHVRYTGDISVAGTVQFAIPASASGRQFNLVSEDVSNYINIASSEFATKTFIDFNNVANQGNYLIISNQLLYSGANGVNPVDDYKNYRTSANGGGFNAKVIDIEELVDQFAFGIKKHPLSVKNFLRLTRAKFTTAPQFALLIGHGVAYNEYRINMADPADDRLNLVPTFGWPASDNLLASADGASPIALTLIGRISAVTPEEVSNYLDKVKEYEAAQRNNLNTIADRAWMKNVVLITGSSDVYLGTVLCNYMDSYRQIIEDTLIGAKVTVLCKNSTNPVEQRSQEIISNLFENGLSLVTYFGHSSSTTLEFNIDNPQNYNNPGKYPVFSVNGCNAGNFFSFNAQRFNFNQTLSEKFTLAKQRGGIAFLASTHFGIVNYLNIYLNSFNNLMSKADYGTSLAKISRDASQQLVQIAGSGDYYARLHAEEMTLHGDPALKFNFQQLADYVIEDAQIKINPQFISIGESNFKVNINAYNIGKAIKDSITIEIKRQYPDNSIATLLRKKIPGIYYVDSLSLTVPIVATRDKGVNKIIVTIDADNVVAEVTESNNSVTREFYIYEDEARPVYPYNFSIVNRANVKLYASTANPLSALKQYALEIDTTENFNSPVKVTKTLSSVGGLLEFDPGIELHDSIVYYWRTSLIPATGGEYRWNIFSFVYLAGSTEGFNQSHYFQHLKSETERITLSPGKRQWSYGLLNNEVFLRNGVYPTASAFLADYQNTLNLNTILGAGCYYNEIIFQVLDPVTFKPWLNTFSGPGGLYNSLLSVCGTHKQYNFEYLLNSSASRKNMMDFIDIIPNGSYVIARTNSNPSDAGNTFVDVWKTDTAIYGSGSSLFHKLFNQGFSNLDSFNRARSWIFIFKKNDQANFAPKSLLSQTIYDPITMAVDCPTPDTIGYITSPAFGPAKAWKKVHWRGNSLETVSHDEPSVSVIGVAPDGSQNVLYTLDKNTQDFDISSVNSSQYPYLKLKMRNIDSVDITPYQLNYWRIDYDPVPEGALTPNLYFKTKNSGSLIDTLEIGEKLNFGIAFKNISNNSFDSVKVKLYVLDRNNTTHNIIFPRRKPLIAADSIRFDYEIDTKEYPEMNTLYIDFNPDSDQQEVTHFNNFMFRNFYVKPDKTNPLLDVTFDNVHILNRDIVSAKPHIQIRLKDEAKYLLLNDTAGMTVQVRFPDNSNTIRTYQFGTDTLRFIPAASGTDNTAIIDFNPQFLNQINPDGDEYELIVTGKDRSGNKAGTAQYKVTFRVISKPMISNLLNYPNPFTTSTAFVFTITGSEVPDNMKIQILTVTGKIVREITKQELGPLHIGRNITDYKWDGNDQYGQRLANGVYLYRFVTTLAGKRMDKYSADGDNTDKFFTRGYGKMYLMR